MPPPDYAFRIDALSDAMLLAATGGLLDAVVYLNHGHVFANAMTGNIIFLGIAFLGHNWGDIVPHLVPLAGFFAGVLTSKHFRTSLGSRALLFGLALEIATIFVLGWMPAPRASSSVLSASAFSQVPSSVRGPPRVSAIIPCGSPNPFSSRSPSALFVALQRLSHHRKQTRSERQRRPPSLFP
jgi:hypothetical protein